MYFTIEPHAECVRCKRPRDIPPTAERTLQADGELYVETPEPCPQCGARSLKVIVDVDLT